MNGKLQGFEAITEREVHHLTPLCSFHPNLHAHVIITSSTKYYQTPDLWLDAPASYLRFWPYRVPIVRAPSHSPPLTPISPINTVRILKTSHFQTPSLTIYIFLQPEPPFSLSPTTTILTIPPKTRKRNWSRF